MSSWDEAIHECREMKKCLIEAVDPIAFYPVMKRIHRHILDYGTPQIQNFLLVAMRKTNKVCSNH